jgi:3-hydroxyacyl-CoA dehydrogenase/enoyl-CoA hydratase/3-hydroxybutyryl-CoA epimerase
MDTLTLHIDADGIATLTIDVPGQSMNVIGPQFITDLSSAIDTLSTNEAIKGVVICSGKPSGFMAGLDLKNLDAMLPPPDAAGDMAALFDRAFILNALLRRLETCEKPVVAAVEGMAVGGGFELMLACHRRIVADSPSVQLGLPEIQVGLFPGSGGSQRFPRIVGVQTALLYMLQGKLFRPAEALQLKVVDEVVPATTTVAAAKAWLKANPTASVQAWDQKGYKFPGGAGGFNPAFIQTFVAATAMTMKETQRTMNAPLALLSAVYEGALLPFDRAIRIESKYFAKVVAAPQAHNMVRSLFINKQAAERGARRPKDVAKAPTAKLAMLGAGMMGAGIATVSAQAGMEVVLLDRSLADAEKGKAHVRSVLEKRLGRGMTQEKMDAILARVTPTEDVADVAGADLVIEAVFEDKAIKADITKRVEAVLGADVIFGSNTSTMPITGLAEAWSKPENFIGIHFFSPAEKMPLVEIIVGKRTGPAAIAKALDYVAQIKKTPIVVNDSRGFYTSRCFGTYVREGAELLADGVVPALIENAGRQLGMAVGPLAVSDEVSIELAHKVMIATKKELGDAYVATRSDEIIKQMVEGGRLGRKNGKGYYDYPEGGQKSLWPGLGQLFPQSAQQPDPEAVKERLLYRQLVECARCLEEGVLETVEDGDLGAIFGWGFAPWTGGPFSHMDTVGIATVVDTLDRLAAQHGPRFSPPELLRKMAAEKRHFYGQVARKAA